MPRLTRLLALTQLTRLPWAALPREEETDPLADPLAGPPLEFATQDGALFQTADGVYFGVTE